MYDLKEIEYKKYDFFQEDYLYNFSPNWKNNEIQKNLIKHIADELEKTITHENYTSFRYIHFLIKLIKKYEYLKNVKESYMYKNYDQMLNMSKKMLKMIKEPFPDFDELEKLKWQLLIYYVFGLTRQEVYDFEFMEWINED